MRMHLHKLLDSDLRRLAHFLTSSTSMLDPDLTTVDKQPSGVISLRSDRLSARQVDFTDDEVLGLNIKVWDKSGELWIDWSQTIIDDHYKQRGKAVQDYLNAIGFVTTRDIRIAQNG